MRFQLTISLLLAANSLALAQDSTIAPTHKNLSYGSHMRQCLDFFQAKSDQPTPVAVFFHGGGWSALDKSRVMQAQWELERLVEAGISVATVDYRLIADARSEGISPPVRACLEDAARSIQFLRSKARRLNIDSTRIAAQGGSAGACSALWVAYRDDLADPTSSDPVRRESSRVMCVAVRGAQTTLDPLQMRAWIPNITYGPHAFGITAVSKEQAFEFWLSQRDQLLPKIEMYSPYHLVTSDDPPTFLEFQTQLSEEGQPQEEPTHSSMFGVKLAEKLTANDVEAILVYPGKEHQQYQTVADFLIDRLLDSNQSE